ncbi:DUF6527 family protein [Cupriavidus basilensis]|nr:DUF6527 family protein [Cupriavidus basilensis]MCP3024549.1 DUF6527 family protein [Cupriavidus basilensis]
MLVLGQPQPEPICGCRRLRGADAGHQRRDQLYRREACVLGEGKSRSGGRISVLSKVLQDSPGNGLSFRCPGCGASHTIQHGDGPGPRWGCNGDVERPTFTPSVLVRTGHDVQGYGGGGWWCDFNAEPHGTRLALHWTGPRPILESAFGTSKAFGCAP